MYTGNVLSSFEIQGCCSVQHVIGSLCLFSNGQTILVDVRTGEKIRTFAPVHITRSLSDPSEKVNVWAVEVRSAPALSSPTHVEYIIPYTSDVWVDEYAQV
jgi:hypothetical protein